MRDVEIRCECSKRPILGIMRWRAPYWIFHIRVYKQRRTYAEILVEEGVLRLRCRECQRWFKLRIQRQKNLKIPPLPKETFGWPLKDDRSNSYLAPSDANAACD